jgi:hypothetical protein
MKGKKEGEREYELKSLIGSKQNSSPSYTMSALKIVGNQQKR